MTTLPHITTSDRRFYLYRILWLDNKFDITPTSANHKLDLRTSTVPELTTDSTNVRPVRHKVNPALADQPLLTDQQALIRQQEERETPMPACRNSNETRASSEHWPFVFLKQAQFLRR